MLVKAHVDDIVPDLGTRLEVVHHGGEAQGARSRKRTEESGRELGVQKVRAALALALALPSPPAGMAMVRGRLKRSARMSSRAGTTAAPSKRATGGPSLTCAGLGLGQW